jgi:hypothetical protein
MVGGCAVAFDQVAASHGHHFPVEFDPNVEGFVVVWKAF